jgi:hypothetical protein
VSGGSYYKWPWHWGNLEYLQGVNWLQKWAIPTHTAFRETFSHSLPRDILIP